MQPFETLTTRGKGNRLRQLAYAALQQYDLDVTRLRLLYNLWNCVFRVDTADGQKYVIRINRPGERTLSDVQSELAWLAALNRDTHLRVPHPLPNRSGALVTEAAADGVPEARMCSVFAWVPGPLLAQRLNPATIEQFGVLSARLHDHAATFKLPSGCTLNAFDKVFPGVEPVVVFEGPYAEKFTAEDRDAMRAAVTLSERGLTRLAETGAARRVVHGDLIGWNIKVWRGELCPLDFEGMTFGHPIQDIGVSLLHTFFPAYEADALHTFRRGYETVLPWPERYPGELALWMAWRALTLANLFVQSPDPEEQSWVPGCVTAMKHHMQTANHEL